MTNRSVRCVVISFLALTLGCYQYAPLPGQALPGADEYVRVRVREEFAERIQLVDILFTSPTTLEGRILTSDAFGVEVRVPIRDPQQQGFRERDLYQHVSIPIGDIRSLDIRQLDRTRTGIAVGGVIVALGALFLGSLTGTFGGNTGPGEPDKELLIR